MNVLSIGNSFSVDAQRYLHQIARADGVDMNVYNLVISGCPLDYHFRNMITQEPNYAWAVNGHDSGIKVSLQQGLFNRQWDVITLQQASPKSFQYETYQPYLNKLVEYIRENVPKVKIYLQQTWAYDESNPCFQTILLGETPESMLKLIKEANRKAGKEANVDGIIPSGEVLMKLLKNGVESVHRDRLHATFGLGRYAIGLTWYSTLTGKSILDNTFSDFDEEVSEELVALAKKCVTEVLS